jgi:hypothetical protein
VIAAALALTVATAQVDLLFTTPPGVSEGHMNVRSGPGAVTPQQPRVERDSVPIYLSNQGASVLVDMILGGEPVRLMLDAGATTSLISRSIVDVIVRNGNGSWQGSKRFGMADVSVRTAPIILIKDVRIGQHLVRGGGWSIRL